MGTDSEHRAVIVGGGFGGLACARALAGGPVQVVLVDRRDYHLFTPLLYQVATALLTAVDICCPLRSVFRGARNVALVHDAVTGIDLERSLVLTGAGEQIPYDSLVLAAGGVDDHFGNAALARHTLSLKTLAGAQRLRNHVLACIEHADRESDEQARR
ncbi:MAG: NAD(P)/FAD-dependent oxidoreductase, partial [Solirubrobacteraceae bacterium]